MAVIACLDLDPFLVGLVQRLRPDDHVIEVEPAELHRSAARRYGAIVAAPTDAFRPGPDTPLGLAERMVVITGDDDGWVPSTHPGPVLRRPVDSGELRLALGQVLPAGRWARLRHRFRQLPADASTDGVFAVARVAAATAGAALAFTIMSSPPVVIVLGVFVWSVLRIWFRESIIGLVLVDAALATAAILPTGGTDSPFLLFVAVVAAEVGYAFPSVTGSVVVGGVTLAGVAPLALAASRGRAAVAEIVAWGALIPIASTIGVLAARIRRGRHHGTLDLLQELHDTLDRLSKQAQGVAGTLAVDGVVEQVLVSMREDLGARAGLVLLGDTDVLTIGGAFGTTGPLPSRVVVETSRREVELPPLLFESVPFGQRVVSRLRARGVDRGVLLVIEPRTSGRDAREALDALAAEATVALGNAELFERIRDLTVDGERKRLARDLHDGVIQSLVHVRFELDLVGRLLDDDAAHDIHRVRDVVGSAVDEVRATVNDLRSVRLSAGLGTALATLAREHDTAHVRVVVDAAPVTSLTPEAELQLLRIAQEAVSNAVQHGRATAIYVRLWEDASQVHLQVLDDGHGMAPGPIAAGRGVGLRAMQERADLLGAALDLGPGTDGGTCVQVDVPVGRADS